MSNCTCDYVAKLLSNPLACSYCCKNLRHGNFETLSCNITLWLASKYGVSFEVLVLVFYKTADLKSASGSNLLT